MSKDKYFRKLMKSEDDPVRDEIWENIKDKAVTQPSAEHNSSDTLAIAKNRFNKKRLLCIICAFIFIMGIAVASYYIFRNNNLPKSRYCTLNEYHIENTSQTVKQYLIGQNLKIAYIDWYGEIEYCFNLHYKLNDTQELICLYEEVIDSDGNFCYLYITDNYTDLDILQTFTQSCVESVEHNGRKLLYGIESQTSYVIAEDNGYKYYIKVEENSDRDFIFSLVDKLFERK